MANTKPNVQIRRDNENNLTYVMKRFPDNSFIFTIYQLRNGCYVIMNRKTGICNPTLNFFV